LDENDKSSWNAFKMMASDVIDEVGHVFQFSKQSQNHLLKKLIQVSNEILGASLFRALYT
jgi:ABC-type microcin C transport system permease subunit YejB